MKIYFEGTSDGQAIKIGKTRRSTAKRRGERVSGYWAHKARGDELLLAAIETDAANETHLKNHFSYLVITGEYFKPEPELVEYVHWLRDQSFTWLCDDAGPDEQPGYESFSPSANRRKPLPTSDDVTLFEDWHVRQPMPLTVDLRGTEWARLSIPRPVYNDYYTPPWLIQLAREGMGGIDLDAASHWSANRVHQIPKYFDRNINAHTQRWNGRVWLNAPYGDNKPWIDDVVRNWDCGDMTQLCWLAPAWAFNTRQARPVMERASLVVLLTIPTTMFWGWGKTTESRPEIFCGPDEATLGPQPSTSDRLSG